MNRRPSAKKASEIMQNDVVQIIYEDDGADIADTVGQTLSNDDLEITVVKSTLTHTKDGQQIWGSATVNAIIMTPDILRVLQENEQECFTGVFTSATKTIMMIPKQFEIENCKKVLAEKYKMSSKWQVTHIGRSAITFKRSILDILEMVEQRNSAPTLKLCNIVPHTIRSIQDSVYVVFRSDVPAHVTVTVLDELGSDVTFKTTRMNASMFSFKPKGLTHGEKKIEVKVGDEYAGLCSVIIKSQTEVFSDLLADVINPVTFMCDVMGVSEKTKDALDTDFVDRFSNGKCSEPMNNLMTGNSNFDDCDTRSSKLYPTLLHFAAHYGLPGLCKILLEYPGADIAKRLKNRDSRTPYDLAKLSEERYLAELLLDDNCVIERRGSRGESMLACASGEFETDERNSPPPLPNRGRLSSEQIWSRRMTVAWEDNTTPQLLQLSNDSNEPFTTHF
ncbi:uncharacterized protein LOC110446933 isoform X2 [Mizuhopecten yessoensis]|uniref:uncharacterized protein LOC110446933 isoform X2 n=1 Tax=Mizuhopecten yessoensis TaxID=6573 RepID=UPI000B45D8EF|nr:uncharacterized protein LOC110446933 isoform X2 [Mizuhopecten yessoensis]